MKTARFARAQECHSKIAGAPQQKRGDSFASRSRPEIWRKCVAGLLTSGAQNMVRTRSSEPAPAHCEAGARTGLSAHFSEKRPFVRNNPVSRATRGDTNIPMWLTGSVM